MASHRFRHYLCLAGAIALGVILRFWHLDLKPLWMDEVITAIFSLGKSYNDLPLDKVLPLEQLPEIFAFQPGVSYSEIAKTVATQSTHPPLFFCWMYSWLGLVSPLGEDWVAKLRSPSALFGVGAIAAIYYVNRTAFFPFAGLMAAALMAVSPFAVYLSQEARHYTLPMFLITLALLGLVQIQQDIEKRQKVRFFVWLAWAIVNIIGLYTHYFCALAFIAQIATLLLLMYCYRGSILNQRKTWVSLILSSCVVAIGFLPWLAIGLYHSGRTETNWIDPPQHITPLVHTLISWVLMVIALPVENQPLHILLISGFLMLCFTFWVGCKIFEGLRQLWCTPSTHFATLTLLSFSVWVLLEFLAISYFLGKDITSVPRYNFVYYPSFCALFAVSISQQEERNVKQTRFLPKIVCLITEYLQRNGFSLRKSGLICFLVGMTCSLFVVSNLVFQKPFQPERVARIMNQDPSTSLMVIMAYRDYQDIALGLSFALALEPLRTAEEAGEKIPHSLFPIPYSPLPTSEFAFFKQSPDFTSVWQKLSQLPTPTATHLNLWVIGPGRKRKDYPPQVAISSQSICKINLEQHYRIGIPYQLYHCKNLV